MTGQKNGLLRVEWSPGTDDLTGICHCGAEHRADDPTEIWAWLLAHPNHEATIG
ncbi:hypothetical protein [Actinomadura sp. CNU-125]|uniref:hypothetical protein n=1 Tax=Actinomadura sp. CNU-125 TaxID=1904961 RepID=UPI001651F897|nr:hypothetical protein [Actinomadura sp. CNU-125]